MARESIKCLLVLFVEIMDLAADCTGVGLVESVFFTLAVALSSRDGEFTAATTAPGCQVTVWADSYSTR